MRFVKGIKNSGKQADRDTPIGQPANPAPSGTVQGEQDRVDSSVADDLDDMFDFLEDGDARNRASTGSNPAAVQSTASAAPGEITQLPIKRAPIKRASVKRNSVGVLSSKHSPVSGMPSTAANHPATDVRGGNGYNTVAPEQKLPDDRTGKSNTDDLPDTNFDFLSDEPQPRARAEGISEDFLQQSRLDQREMFDTGGFGPAARSESKNARLAAIALGLLSAAGAAGYVYYTQYNQQPVDRQVGDLVVNSSAIENSSPIDRSGTDDQGQGESQLLASNQSSSQADTPSAAPTLREQRDDTINTLRSLIATGDFDTASQLLATMDPVLYGYGQIEFVEIEKIAAELKEKPGSPELLTKLDSIGVSTTVSVDEQVKSAAEIQSSETEQLALAEQKQLSSAVALAEQERQLELARLAGEIDAARQIKTAEIARQAALAIEAEEARLAGEKNTADRLVEQARQAKELRLAEQSLRAEELRLSEEALQAEEVRLAEQARQAEEARLAERTRQAEEVRLAEQARQAEEARLAEQARQAEEARLAEQARQAEKARLAEQVRQAEEARLAERARQVEEARLAEQARQAEETRLAEQTRQAEETSLAALSASTAASAELDTRQQQFQKQQVELARRALEQQRAAEALAMQKKNADTARRKKTAEDERRAKLLQQAEAEAEAQRRSQPQELSTLKPPQTVQRQPVTDADMEIVWRRFTRLKSAIEAGDMTAILKISEPSGAKVQMYLQLFENFDKVNVRITNLAAQNRAETIRGTLRIVSMVRSNGDVTYPSDKYRDNLLTSKRENGEWSRIKW